MGRGSVCGLCSGGVARPVGTWGPLPAFGFTMGQLEAATAP